VRVPDDGDGGGHDGGTWIAVPPDKILPRHDNPTGEPVTCWTPALGVMCFVEGAGT
jgi:hypothetical protein